MIIWTVYSDLHSYIIKCLNMIFYEKNIEFEYFCVEASWLLERITKTVTGHRFVDTLAD